MTEDKQGQSRKRKRLVQVAVGIVLLLAALIVPPMVNVSRYKSRITQLISTSLGRQVRLGSVEARLLPLPGFAISDLTVEEDPRYGAEPTLRANSVRVSIRLFSLWRGRLEIGSIRVDEASLNLVRAPQGWNIDQLFRTAATRMQAEEAGGVSQSRRMPSFSASNSRINIKDGAEKLPFSLLNTTLSLTPQQQGAWRFQLKGQPARTDLRLDLGDTGTLRLEGTARGGAELRHLALKLDLSWREAQLGQLSRLLVGRDPGWRGALTGDLHLEGTPESSQIKARLRAAGVHRAEFAPDARLDFDANCAFNFHALSGAYEKLTCESPIGNGRVRLTGERPESAPLKMKVELDKLPVQAVLDVVRTVRSGLGEGLDAGGAISGQMNYAAPVADSPPAVVDKAKGKKGAHAALPSPLTGALTVEGFRLSGKSLSDPVEQAKIVLTPAAPEAGQRPGLAASMQLTAGGQTPLNVALRVSLSGYRLAFRGPVTLARASQWLQVAGLPDSLKLNGLSGDAATVDLTAEGPWLPQLSADGSARRASGADQIEGNVQLRNVTWKNASLVRPLQIASASIHLGVGTLRWEPVEFALGPVKGTATLDQPMNCASEPACIPRFHLEFASLDAEVLQSALLGAEKKGTLLSELIARVRPEASRSWPRAEGSVHAATFQLGPVAIKNFSTEVKVKNDLAELDRFDGSVLGGAVHGKGTVSAAKNERGQPSYEIEAEFQKLAATALGQLVGQRFSGGPIDLAGKMEATGYRGADLAASAKGTVRFEWQHGMAAGAVPPALARFEQWTAEWALADGALKTTKSEVKRSTSIESVPASVSLELKPKISFAAGEKPKP